MISRFLAFRWFAVFFILATLAVNWVGLTSIQRGLDALGNSSRTGPLWFATQLEFELLRFQKSLVLYGDTAIGIPADEVRLRFDILWSRQAIAAEGQGMLPAPRGTDAARAVHDLGVALREQEDTVEALTGDTRERAADLLAVFDALELPLHQYTLSAKAAQAHADEMARADLLFISRLMAVLGVAVGLASLLVATVFFIDARQQRLISRENVALLEETREAYKAKSRFLSTVSHELRTPLTVIKGATELLARANVAAEPEKVEKLIRLARDNAETLARLVDDLLDVQRLEKAEFSISMERLDLNQLAETALTRIESYQANKPMTFEFRPAPVAVPVDGDRQRLMQVLANILSNAIKFSKDPGVVRLSVSVVGSQAEVRISDNGIGIPEDARAKVFGRFTQVDSSDTRNRGGSGLGMHITQQILEQHGGSIDYESVIGEGTTFIALVPLAVAAPVADKGAEPVVEKPAPVQVAS